jgi:hypothetical protein
MSYFDFPSYSSDINSELTFLRSIIGNLNQVVNFFPVGLIPSTINSELVFRTESSTTERISLSVEGTVMFIYIRIFKEPFPTEPTPLQRERINAIWEGVGRPENIIPI